MLKSVLGIDGQDYEWPKLYSATEATEREIPVFL